MIVFLILFLILILGFFEFLIFRQRNQYQKNLALIEELNLKLGILRSLSYLLQSKQTLREDWNQMDKILSAQNLFKPPADKGDSAVDNFAKLLVKKHELNKELTPEQQREAVSVKW